MVETVRVRAWLAYGCVGVALCLTFGFDTRPAPQIPRSRQLRPVRAELQRIVDDLARDGLPVGLVTRKVREGEAKRVAAARVLAAARGVAADVRLADRIVRKYHSRPARRAQLIEAAVTAHRAGVPLAGIDRVVGAAARLEVPAGEAALYAAADLAGRGYVAERAAELVVALMARDRRGYGLPRVLAVVEAERAARGSRTAALDAVINAIEAGADSWSAGLLEPTAKQR